MKINNQNAKISQEQNTFHVFSHRDDSKGPLRDDSQGPASTQKLNYLYLHFESGDSQHEGVAVKKPSIPSCSAFENFVTK